MDNLATIFSLVFSLFLLMDSIGNIPIAAALLKNIDPARHKFILFREMVIALIALLIFYAMGDKLLTLLGVSTQTVQIAGGIILFVVALKMVFPALQDTKEKKDDDKEEPFIVPLAIPLVAGPASLAAVTLYSRQQPASIALPAIIIAWLISTVVMILSSYLRRVVGARGIIACERLMGLLLILIAVQMFMEGTQKFLALAM